MIRRLTGTPRILAPCALLVGVLTSLPALGQTPPRPGAPDATPAADKPDGEADEAGADGAAGTAGDAGAGDAGAKAPEEGAPTEASPRGAARGGAAAGAAGGGRAGAAGPGPGPGTGFGVPLFQPPPEAADTKAKDAAEKDDDAPDANRTARVFAEDWWTNARPSLEFHGYLRMRSQFFQDMDLRRRDPPSGILYPRPLDVNYTATDSSLYGAALCTGSETGASNSTDATNLVPCENRSTVGANIRFRINPEIHVSDNLRIISQIDLLDNLVLGTTPEGYGLSPDAGGGYSVVNRGGFNGIGFYDSSQAPPESGVNGLKDSIRVKRVWGEYSTPLGIVKFGRMPWHWGLGMMYNAGDAWDDDAQTTVDRIMFTTGIKSLDLYFSGGWDMANEGATTAPTTLTGLQEFDAAQYDDVNQYMASVARKKDPALQKLALARGEVVVNGGFQLVYRQQRLANDLAGNASDGAWVPNASLEDLAQTGGGFVRRAAETWTPDLWFQLLYYGFRLELEAVTVQGSIENTENAGSNFASTGGDGFSINQWGFASELEQKLVENRLHLGFKFGWASGDSEVDDSNRPGGGGLLPAVDGGAQDQLGDTTISTFAFHPSYRVDLILNRNLLTRVTGSYYFAPSVSYDFIRNDNGQKLGGHVNAIWTRASHFLQTPGAADDLGIELNGGVYFQSKDGALNDDPDRKGGLFTMIQYGVLFPLAGLGYADEEGTRIRTTLNDRNATDLTPAQILRWYVGIFF